MAKAPEHDGAIARACSGMTGRTVDVEALTPALHHFARQRERHLFGIRVVVSRFFESKVFSREPARHSARRQGARRLTVLEERALLKRPQVPLTRHLLNATGHCSQDN